MFHETRIFHFISRFNWFQYKHKVIKSYAKEKWENARDRADKKKKIKYKQKNTNEVN